MEQLADDVPGEDARTTVAEGAEGAVDAALVAAALAGDRQALGRIYERHADRVHTMCVHMLGDRHEAADVCGDVFLAAFERLGQLREPARLKPWLFAIARHQVYRRTKLRRRTDLMEEVDEMGTTASEQELDEHTVDPAGLVRLIEDAAGGLDERDRMVMELQLQGLDGEDLAAALGTSTSTAYQHVHRMKDRLGRSIGAVLVARQGRTECEELDRVLRDWDGTFSVLWRKRVARHVDGCEVCERRRKAVPAVLLGGVAAAAPMLGASAVSAAPTSVRDRVLRDAQVTNASTARAGERWGADGFPPAGLPAGSDMEAEEVVATPAKSGSGARALFLAVALLLLIGLAALVAWQLLGDDDQELSAAQATSETVITSTSTTAAPAPPIVPASPVDPGADIAMVPPLLPGEVAEERRDAPAPLPVPDPGESDPAPTVAAPVPLEVQILRSPSIVYHPTVGFPDCGASTPFVVAAPTASAVVLVWGSAGGSGSTPMVRQGAEWVGALEVPAGVAGPLEIRALAVDVSGTQGVSEPLARAVEDCIAPG